MSDIKKSTNTFFVFEIDQDTDLFPYSILGEVNAQNSKCVLQIRTGDYDTGDTEKLLIDDIRIIKDLKAMCELVINTHNSIKNGKK